jgi:hypothetical protein
MGWGIESSGKTRRNRNYTDGKSLSGQDRYRGGFLDYPPTLSLRCFAGAGEAGRADIPAG